MNRTQRFLRERDVRGNEIQPQLVEERNCLLEEFRERLRALFSSDMLNFRARGPDDRSSALLAQMPGPDELIRHMHLRQHGVVARLHCLATLRQGIERLAAEVLIWVSGGWLEQRFGESAWEKDCAHWASK